jgi:hypothetical protein
VISTTSGLAVGGGASDEPWQAVTKNIIENAKVIKVLFTIFKGMLL